MTMQLYSEFIHIYKYAYMHTNIGASATNTENSRSVPPPCCRAVHWENIRFSTKWWGGCRHCRPGAFFCPCVFYWPLCTSSIINTCLCIHCMCWFLLFVMTVTVTVMLFVIGVWSRYSQVCVYACKRPKSQPWTKPLWVHGHGHSHDIYFSNASWKNMNNQSQTKGCSHKYSHMKYISAQAFVDAHKLIKLFAFGWPCKKGRRADFPFEQGFWENFT